MDKHESADARRQRRESLIEEARVASGDPVDRAEMRAVADDMDSLTRDWPYDPDDRPPAESTDRLS